MKKLVITLFAIFLTLNVQAKSVKNGFENVIEESGVDVQSISVSIKNVKNGKTVFTLNDKMLMNPASVQKVLTTPVSLEALGSDYSFTTSMYSRSNDTYIIKLGADPYLKSTDLKKLTQKFDNSVKKVYVDDSILDTKTWGEGWQWDDDMNVLMPRFGSYNLDKNLIKLTIMPSSDSNFATIINPSKYPLVFFNNITNGNKTDINVQRDNTISANTLMLTGTVARPTVLWIPSNNLKRYFDIQLLKTLENRKIYPKEFGLSTKVNNNDVLIDSVKHDIEPAISDILKNSNNLVSETLFKLAGAKHGNIETGSDFSGIKMFNDYCQKNGLDNSRIRITDASGVSKNNLVSTDFVTDFLVLNKDNKVLEKLPSPGEGTLTHRMLPIKNNLKAKTGTLSDISSIAGFLTSKSGKKYAFCIISNDMQLSASDKKMLEDFILREAYLRL